MDGNEDVVFVQEMFEGFAKELNSYRPFEDILSEAAPELGQNEHIQDALLLQRQQLADFRRTIEYSGLIFKMLHKTQKQLQSSELQSEEQAQTLADLKTQIQQMQDDREENTMIAENFQQEL